MSTIGAVALTLNDWARRVEDGGKMASIVEIMNQTNEIIADAKFVEGNLPTGHKTTVRSGLPSATWRLLNYGVQPSKSRTVQITDNCGMLEAYAEVDKSLADLNGNTAEFRLSEDKAFIEAMNQEFASTLIYGDSSKDPEEFMGLEPRYNSTTAENGTNVLDGGGSGSTNTSMWLVVWGDSTCHCIFPKGKPTGLQHQDLGEQTLLDDATPAGKFQGYRSHYKWDVGLTLRDWRYVVRIANIDVTALTKTGSTGADLVDLMIQAIEKIPNISMGTAVFYCNTTVRSFLRRQVANKSNVHLSLDEFAGKKIVTIDGIPIKRVDAILNTESHVA